MIFFDQPIDRRQTNSYKWDKYQDPNVIPVWVADMDFRVAPPIQEALQKITNHGVFGYSRCPDELFEVVIDRLKNQHNWDIKKEWMIWLPGLVPGISLAVRAFTAAHENVMTATPVYHPFMIETEAAQRELIKVPLVEKDNRYTFDFDAIRAAITPDTKMFLLCNPHNPGGMMTSKAELDELLELCLAHQILICSDEIHCDLVIDDTKQHHSIATFSEAAAQNSITLLAPSKTFNIAGLGCSFAVIPNDELRAKFIKTKAGLMPMISSYSFEATLAGYRDGAAWHQELLEYLRSNHQFLLETINQMKGLRMLPLEATYLAWIDAREAGFENITEALEKAGVGISNGTTFGSEEGFFRLNFACTRSTLEEVVKRMQQLFGEK